MADIADIAQARMELEDALRQRATTKPLTVADSADCCADCGDEIPTARQHAVPGCQFCRECAEKTERLQRNYR